MRNPFTPERVDPIILAILLIVVAVAVIAHLLR